MTSRANMRVTNTKTLTVHYAEVENGEIKSILCNVKVTDNYDFITTGERFCKRCIAAVGK